MKITSIFSAPLLALLALASVLFAQARDGQLPSGDLPTAGQPEPVPPQRPSTSPTSPTSPPAPPLRPVRVGERHYSGPHTWDGVITVTGDSVSYEGGEIKAAPGGIPQGVTFAGSRSRITLRDLKFEGVGDGINIGNNQRVDHLTIDNCQFTNTRTPDANSKDHLLGSRGNAFFGAKGEHWVIKDSTFKTKCKEDCSEGDVCYSVQYAMRLGEVSKLNVKNSTFENRNGKATMWLMFVKDALFEDCTFKHGRITVGARPNDIGDIQKGDCNNLVFRNCTFDFDKSEDWPCSFNIYPGTTSVHFINCTFKSKGDWWLEVDSREVSNVHWDSQCTWNGKPIAEYTGVRSSMSVEEMASKDIAPAETHASRS